MTGMTRPGMMALPGSLGYPYMVHPGYPSMYHPGTPLPPRPSAPALHYSCTGQKSAMGSKTALRNSQTYPYVLLEQTIWVLAAFIGPCCKNQMYQKAPEYLRLSIPRQRFTRLEVLP